VGNVVVKKTPIRRKRNNNFIDDKKVIIEDFSAPIWLKGLFLCQKSSSIFCCLMIGAMLVVYGMTVYAPQMWTKEFNKLKKLQKDERQIISTNEVVKEQLVKQADQDGIGFVNPDPSQTLIFLPETAVNPLGLNENKEKSKIRPPFVLSPIAY
jgi:hypothetical protein